MSARRAAASGNAGGEGSRPGRRGAQRFFHSGRQSLARCLQRRTAGDVDLAGPLALGVVGGRLEEDLAGSDADGAHVGSRAVPDSRRPKFEEQREVTLPITTTSALFLAASLSCRPSSPPSRSAPYFSISGVESCTSNPARCSAAATGGSLTAPRAASHPPERAPRRTQPRAHR